MHTIHNRPCLRDEDCFVTTTTPSDTKTDGGDCSPREGPNGNGYDCKSLTLLSLCSQISVNARHELQENGAPLCLANATERAHSVAARPRGKATVHFDATVILNACVDLVRAPYALLKLAASRGASEERPC